MSRHTRILKSGPDSLFDEHVAMTNPARINFHAHLPNTRLRNVALYQLPIPICSTNLSCLHLVIHARSFRLITIHFNDCVSKRLRRFLWQVVPDAAFDKSVRILAREFLCINTRIWVRCAVRVTFECDRGHTNYRTLRESSFKIVALSFTLREAEAAAVVVNHNLHVIGLSNDAALRSNVASSKFHFGDASCQISLLKSRRYFS